MNTTRSAMFAGLMALALTACDERVAPAPEPTPTEAVIVVEKEPAPYDDGSPK